MANLTFRVANPTAPNATVVKNEPLLNIEIDGNFKSLDDAKFEKTGGTITGDVIVTGTVTATDVNSTSDKRLKTDIEHLSNALDKIKSISGYSYRFTASPERKHVGVLAQEVNQVIPEVVSGSEETSYSVMYGNMVAYLIEAIKELDQKVEKLINEKE